MIPSEALKTPSRLPAARGRSERASTLFGDRAENSIMQTISIAVSAILIAAGLITAPSLINNARDTNAKQDLANIAQAQEYELSDKGKYAATVSSLNSVAIKLTTSGDASSIKMYAGSDCYAAFSKSSSNNVFYRTSTSSEFINMTKTWSAIRPSGYPTNCEWPIGFSNVNLALNPYALPMTGGWSNNSGAVHNSSFGAAPTGHPLGIATAVKSWPIVSAQHLASMYNVDGLGSSSSARIVGYWVYVNATGYAIPATFGMPYTALAANTWTYVQTTKPITGWSALYIKTIDGSIVPAGDFAWATGAVSYSE